MAVRHELSWSASRASTWQSCPRRYYYDYYLAWGGWDERATAERRRVWLLKKMTRLPMLAGDALHRALARWFEGKQQGHVAGEEEIAEHALGLLREGYKESRDGKWKLRPAKLTRLAEHHYRESSIDESSGAAAEYGKRFVERIRSAVKAFFADPRLTDVRASEPRDWLACEEMGTFDLEGTKVYAVPDFAHLDSNGRVHIWDWKTGRPRPEDRFQLAVYTLYAEAVWGVDTDTVTCADAYLGEGEVVRATFARSELDALRSTIADSLAAMRALHFDAALEAGDPERFPMLPLGENAKRECATCNYREVCGR
jgi:CRISPR/Cas system-associated exonuclease Cas4 (RecB family)